jgi:hypothetical protein
MLCLKFNWNIINRKKRIRRNKKKKKLKKKKKRRKVKERVGKMNVIFFDILL